jgi:hypothetical protein
VNDFAFLAGDWTVTNRRLRTLLVGGDEWDEFPASSHCTMLFGGAANVDRYDFPTLGSAGVALRLFDPARQLWSIYWASSRDGILQPPVEGRFTGHTGTFVGDDTHDRRPIRVRYSWAETTSPSPRWEQAFSTDHDRTWETNWIMTFTRPPTPVTNPGPTQERRSADHS